MLREEAAMLTFATVDAPTRTRQLHEQHREWERDGYDGHNRHSGLTPMSTLRARRMRRRVRRSLIWLARAWDPAPRNIRGGDAYTASITA
jgi:hypothetical protein